MLRAYHALRSSAAAARRAAAGTGAGAGAGGDDDAPPAALPGAAEAARLRASLFPPPPPPPPCAPVAPRARRPSQTTAVMASAVRRSAPLPRGTWRRVEPPRPPTPPSPEPPLRVALSASDEAVAKLACVAVEVELSLRRPLRCDADVSAAAAAASAAAALLAAIHALAPSLQLPPVEIFQALLARLAAPHGGPCASVDSARGLDGVPMHQAKVLDRSARLAGACAALEAALPAAQLAEWARAVGELRAALRVKVEDANDLAMAVRAMRAAATFWPSLLALAAAHEASAYETLRALRAHGA
jgi:hypothetical protein